MLNLYASLLLNREEPRFHGNGFVQLPLNARSRLHIWHADLRPLPGHNADIHDHVWDMTSTVLSGFLTHRTYDIREPSLLDQALVDVYQIGAADKPGLGDMLEFKQALIPTGVYHLYERSSYVFPANQLHSSHLEPHPDAHRPLTVTLMTKHSDRGTASPRVVCPTGLTPTDAFADDGQPSHSMMWVVIRHALETLAPWAQQELLRAIA